MASGNTPPFLSKTYDMVDDPATDSIVSWGSVNNTFVVWNVTDFSRDLLPIYFKHGNFSSFLRQLNTYGFRKVDPDRFEFANEGFLRGQKHLLKTISRRRPANPRSQTAPHHDITVESSSTGACVELGDFGLDEGVERLKRDKNVLMQELVRLRQQQQATDSQLAGVGQRVQVMEQRQQQMMSFLAKAMQSPGFFAQFVKQQNESNRRIGDANKKRRLPKEEENDFMVRSDLTSSDGQMVTYQPSPNEAAKVMMSQILKMEAPSRLDNSTDELECFRIDNSSSPSMLDSRTSSSLTSGLTLTDVLSTFVQSKSLADSSFSIGHPADISDSQSSSNAVKNEKPAKQMVADGSNAVKNEKPVKQMAADGPVPQVNVEITDSSFVICDATNAAYINSSSANISGPIDIESDIILPEDCAESLLDDVPRLPAINDSFWEQFLAASPPTSDTDEISSISPTTGATNETDSGQERGSRKTHFIDGLAEQMGLLSSMGRVG